MQSIRTKKKHHIRIAKLEAGYKEQRGWLGVGMARHLVTLQLQAWEELPLLVTYATVEVDGTTMVHEQRFTRRQIDDARHLLKTAGQPGRWPHSQQIVQSLNEGGAHDE